MSVFRDGSIINVSFTTKSAKSLWDQFWNRLKETESLWKVFESKELPTPHDFRSIYSMQLVEEVEKFIRCTLDKTLGSNVTVSFFASPLLTNFTPGVEAQLLCEQCVSKPSRFELYALASIELSPMASPEVKQISLSYLDKESRTDDGFGSYFETEVIYQLLQRHKDHMFFRAYLWGKDGVG
mmetsp:Transcript_26231/g.62335  ORF Transcript_26231/g.62335 Transcript_26231/m.62335 type:complete len:182 (-) Transcript_26231:7-552(-)